MAWRGMADYQGQYSAFSRLLVSVFFFCLIKMCYFGSDVLRYSTWATVSYHHRLSYILTVELTFTFEMCLLKGSSRLSLSFLSPPTSIFLLQHLHSSNHNFVTNWFFFLRVHNKTNFKDLSRNKNSLFSLSPDAKILFILSFGPKCRTCHVWDEAVNNSPYYPVTDKTTSLIHLADSHMMWTRTEERLLRILGEFGTTCLFRI